jgi:alpha-tubulin suppressor-like RCC1 family protein
MHWHSQVLCSTDSRIGCWALLGSGDIDVRVYVAYLDRGLVFAWGNNKFGQLGSGRNTLKNNLPQQIESLANVVQIACGDYHCLSLDRLGKVGWLH